MAEDISSEENKEIPFNNHDLTLLEHIMIGGSEYVDINEKKTSVNSEVLKELQKDPNALRVILTPINLTKGRKTLRDVVQARMHSKILPGLPLTLFEFEPQFKYIQEGINPTLKLGEELDQDNQSKTFGIYFSKDGQKINLPEKAPEEIIVKDVFKKLIEYVGNKDGVMQYRVNAGGGK